MKEEVIIVGIGGNGLINELKGKGIKTGFVIGVEPIIPNEFTGKTFVKGVIGLLILMFEEGNKGIHEVLKLYKLQEHSAQFVDCYSK